MKLIPHRPDFRPQKSPILYRFYTDYCATMTQPFPVSQFLACERLPFHFLAFFFSARLLGKGIP